MITNPNQNKPFSSVPCSTRNFRKARKVIDFSVAVVKAGRDSAARETTQQRSVCRPIQLRAPMFR